MLSQLSYAPAPVCCIYGTFDIIHHSYPFVKHNFHFFLFFLKVFSLLELHDIERTFCAFLPPVQMLLLLPKKKGEAFSPLIFI